jgi:hypothetical protein
VALNGIGKLKDSERRVKQWKDDSDYWKDLANRKPPSQSDSTPKPDPGDAPGSIHLTEQQKPKKSLPVAKQEKKPGPLAPQTDRSIEVGDGARVANSPMITGDNNNIDIRSGPPKPFILTDADQDKMAQFLRKASGSSIHLICIDDGCDSLNSLGRAFIKGKWNPTQTDFGVYKAYSRTDMELARGLHLMQHDAPAAAFKAVQDALTAMEIPFEVAPWSAIGESPIGEALPGNLKLIIGNPQ